MVPWELSIRLNKLHSPYYEKSYDALNKNVRNSPIGDTVLKAVTALKNTIIGASLPKVNALDTAFNQTTLDLQPPKNVKYLFVDIWYSRCGPCLAQLPALDSTYARYKHSGVSFCKYL